MSAESASAGCSFPASSVRADLLLFDCGCCACFLLALAFCLSASLAAAQAVPLLPARGLQQLQKQLLAQLLAQHPDQATLYLFVHMRKVQKSQQQDDFTKRNDTDDLKQAGNCTSRC